MSSNGLMSRIGFSTMFLMVFLFPVQENWSNINNMHGLAWLFAVSTGALLSIRELSNHHFPLKSTNDDLNILKEKLSIAKKELASMKQGKKRQEENKDNPKVGRNSNLDKKIQEKVIEIYKINQKIKDL